MVSGQYAVGNFSFFVKDFKVEKLSYPKGGIVSRETILQYFLVFHVKYYRWQALD